MFEGLGYLIPTGSGEINRISAQISVLIKGCCIVSGKSEICVSQC